jgi:DNA-binding transcriptional ArsR family regulator
MKTEQELSVLANDPELKRRRRALVDPTRARVVALLGDSDGMTAKELAARLGVRPNRLYYHLRVLEEAGVIGVADMKVVGRAAEQVYRVVYTGMLVLDPHDPTELATMLAASLEVSRVRAEDTLYEHAAADGADEVPVVMWSSRSFPTSHDEVEELTGRLEALYREFEERGRRLLEDRDAPEASRCTLSWLVVEQPPARATTERKLDETS